MAHQPRQQQLGLASSYLYPDYQLAEHPLESLRPNLYISSDA